MKKLLLSFVISLIVPVSAFADMRRGSTSDYPEKLWRITESTGAWDAGLVFASAPIVIHSVVVASPTVNISPSYIAIMPSTSVTYGQSVMLSTPIFANTNVIAVTPSPIDITQKTYNFESSSWTYIQKTGNARVQILWDYINPSDTSIPKLKIP